MIKGFDFVGWAVVGLCLLATAATYWLCVHLAQQDCYRGSAAYVDCDLFSPCEKPRVVDPAVEYAKRHPECR